MIPSQCQEVNYFLFYVPNIVISKYIRDKRNWKLYIACLCYYKHLVVLCGLITCSVEINLDLTVIYHVENRMKLSIIAWNWIIHTFFYYYITNLIDHLHKNKNTQRILIVLILKRKNNYINYKKKEKLLMNLNPQNLITKIHV